MTQSIAQRMMTEKKRMETVRISDEKDAISKVTKEINGLIVRSGTSTNCRAIVTRYSMI